MEALVEGKLSFNQSTNTFLFYALLLFILLVQRGVCYGKSDWENCPQLAFSPVVVVL